MCLWPTRTGKSPFRGELVHAAVQNLGFMTTERFAFGKQPTEALTCNDELLYFFLDRHDAFLAVRETHGENISIRLKSGGLFASPRVFQFLPESCH